MRRREQFFWVVQEFKIEQKDEKEAMKKEIYVRLQYKYLMVAKTEIHSRTRTTAFFCPASYFENRKSFYTDKKA